jgi:hypothetical protein
MRKANRGKWRNEEVGFTPLPHPSEALSSGYSVPKQFLCALGLVHAPVMQGSTIRDVVRASRHVPGGWTAINIVSQCVKLGIGEEREP